MAVIAEPERTQLYTRIRHLLGAPLVSVEIEDDMMDSLLELSISDYSQYIQDWLIESQWTSLYNLNLDTQSLSRAFITKSLDYETRYTYAYSKIVGLQAGGKKIIYNYNQINKFMKYQPEEKLMKFYGLLPQNLITYFLTLGLLVR